MKHAFILAAWPLAIAAALACVEGCDNPGYYQGGPQASGSAIPPRSLWRAGGDLASPYKAIDGDTGTAAVSAETYANAALTIDLGKAAMFNMIIIDHGNSGAGFARRVAVLTSMDGKTFIHRHAGPGTRRFTLLCLATPTLARYVRLQAVAQGHAPWTVAEVYVQ